MLTYDIPEDMAREAIQNTDTQEEAERYLLDRIHTIVFQWPEWSDYSQSSGSSPTIK